MHKIEVFFSKTENDSESFSVKNDIVSDLGIEVDSVKIVNCYYINADLMQEQLQKIAVKLFADPIVQNYSINSEKLEIKADWLIEVKLHLNVTDNTGNASIIGVKDLLKIEFRKELNENIRTSKKYFLSGNLNEKQIKRIAKELLANEVIESFEFKKLE